MAYINRTGVPNSILDTHLKHLGYAELKIILVIIRQTYGWVDKRTGSHKEWDWISRRFFVKKTNLSLRSVSKAISSLFSKGLIHIKNEHGVYLYTTEDRRKAHKLFYSINKNVSREHTSPKTVKKSNPTIITHTKLYSEDTSQGMQKISFNHIQPPI
ncbi:replication protein [uncultured Dokdonia sp.]|uniref:replication protein n=1 Tax=uncultured Dokdonia sp. TaxID=575653 RepID=UPI002606D072|nr:replication protein [uncultured Dokdonia sp.]